MSDYVYKNRIYQVAASVCVAVFIVNMAFCLMCGNKFVYNRIYMQQGDEIRTEDEAELSDIQAEIIFSQLSDDFITFFKGDYDITGYDITKDNVKRLNALKWRYRKSVLLVILSVLGFIYCYIELAKRRELAPLVYGSVLSLFLLAFRAFIIMISKSGVNYYIKLMLLKRDYGYFGEGDILSRLFPPDYARYMALLYVGYVVALACCVLLIRKLIVWAGKPHKY